MSLPWLQKMVNIPGNKEGWPPNCFLQILVFGCCLPFKSATNVPLSRWTGNDGKKLNPLLVSWWLSGWCDLLMNGWSAFMISACMRFFIYVGAGQSWLSPFSSWKITGPFSCTHCQSLEEALMSQPLIYLWSAALNGLICGIRIMIGESHDRGKQESPTAIWWSTLAFVQLQNKFS